jgi:hypothetical protein
VHKETCSLRNKGAMDLQGEHCFETCQKCWESLQSRNVIAQLPGGGFDQRTCAASGSTSGMTLGMRMVESGMAHPRWRRKAIM